MEINCSQKTGLTKPASHIVSFYRKLAYLTIKFKSIQQENF